MSFIPRSEKPETMCKLCTSILSQAFSREPSEEEGSDLDISINVSHVTGSPGRPDLDFIRQSAASGCVLCSEMLRIHHTKICNGYDGTTLEADAAAALQAVALKYPRIKVTVVYQDKDTALVPHYLMVYTHEYDEGFVVDAGTIGHDEDVQKWNFGKFQDKEPELDFDTSLYTMLELIKSDGMFFLTLGKPQALSIMIW